MVATSLAILWAAWLAGWLLAGLTAAKTVSRQSRISWVSHTVFIALGAALMLAHPRPRAAFYRQIIPATSWIQWCGVVVTVVGLGYTVWARIHLGRMWSGAVTLKEEHRLIHSGPYGRTRHPIYTGLLLALLGTGISRGTVIDAVGFVLIVIGIMLKIRQEESLLTTHFGSAYERYRAEVPMLVPFIR